MGMTILHVSGSNEVLYSTADTDLAQGTISNADVTIIGERPKVGPHREKMRANIARFLGISAQQINVKATTTERLGFTGRSEGLAAQAVASIELPVR